MQSLLGSNSIKTFPKEKVIFFKNHHLKLREVKRSFFWIMSSYLWSNVKFSGLKANKGHSININA